MRLLPRFRLRTLMMGVAVAAVLLVVTPPWWRYWFRSPWRLVTVADHSGAHESERITNVRLFFDVRKPADAARLRELTRSLQLGRAPFKVERFAAFPKSRYPTFTAEDVRRIDPPPGEP